MAGNRNNSSGSLFNVGSNGNYWSSTVSGSNARNLNFNSSNANMNSNNRANGNSVRCLKDYCPCMFMPQPFLLRASAWHCRGMPGDCNCRGFG